MTRRLAALALLFAFPAAAQTGRVDRQLARDFPGQKKSITRESDANGTRLIELKMNGRGGESEVVITEYGDYLIKLVPARPAALPEPVTALMSSLFHAAPDAVKLIERTTYQVDVQQSGESQVRVEVDATGHLRDLTSALQLNAESKAKTYERVAWREGDEIAARLVRQFDDARVKDVFRNPGTPGFYFAELTADRGSRRVEVVMDARKDVPVWKYEVRLDELPRPILGTVKQLVGRGKILRIMKVSTTEYRIEQTCQGDLLVLDVKPTGDVTTIKGNLSGAAEERPAPRRVTTIRER